MRPLVQSQEDKSAQKTSLPRGAYPILANSGSVMTEGKGSHLQAKLHIAAHGVQGYSVTSRQAC